MEYDPYSPEYRLDPYRIYRWLRDEQPVYYNERRNLYALSRFPDVIGALHDSDRFLSGMGIALVGTSGSPFPNIIVMDNPRHDELRKLAARLFTARAIAAFEPKVRTFVRELVDDFIEHGRVELVHEFTVPLPILVMSELLGVDPDDRDHFVQWSDAMLRQHPDKPETVVAGRSGGQAIGQYFADIIVQRRREPTDDFVSAMLANGSITDEEIIGYCFLFIVAGIETTTNLLGNGVMALDAHRDQRAEVAGDLTLLPNAIEEMLRYEGPVQGLARTTARDVELHGVTIPEGSRVQILYGSANRDEREFVEPDRFEIHRAIRRHVGFGHGIHFCLGAYLARLEARVAFEELLTRLPDWAITDEAVERVPAGNVRGPMALNIEFAAR